MDVKVGKSERKDISSSKAYSHALSTLFQNLLQAFNNAWLFGVRFA